MKKIFLYTLFCTLSIALGACSDDETSAETINFDPNKQELTITKGEVTSTSFSFSIQVKDEKIPYICLYVDKKTIDEVAKGELPRYLMNKLKEQAKETGMTAQAYISSLSLTGNLTNKKIEGLLPGNLYELVAFGVSGTKVANMAEYFFFETLTVDPVECSFEVDVKANSNQAVLDVTASNKEVYFYFNLLKTSEYEKYAQNGRYTSTEIIGALFHNDYQAAMAQFAPTGQLTPDNLQKLLNHLFRKGTASYGVVGLVPETAYTWMVSAFKTADINNDFHIAMASEVSVGTFTSAKKNGNGMTFDIEVFSTEPNSVHISLNPSMTDKTYIWCQGRFTAENSTSTGQELASAYMDEHNDRLNSMVVKGAQEKEITGLESGMRYYVLAWGYEDGVTTLPELYEFGLSADGGLTRSASSYLQRNNQHTLSPATKVLGFFPVRR